MNVKEKQLSALRCKRSQRPPSLSQLDVAWARLRQFEEQRELRRNLLPDFLIIDYQDQMLGRRINEARQEVDTLRHLAEAYDALRQMAIELGTTLIFERQPQRVHQMAELVGMR